MAPSFNPNDEWDNMHGPSRPDVHWSTDNVGEAAPGVLTPLGAAIWGYIGERATRGTFVNIGVIPPSEGGVPALEDRVVRVFMGRIALQVELMTMLGDRLPGASGQDIAKAIFGTVPDDIEYHPTKRRYPVIAWKLGRTFITMPRRLKTEPPKFHRFWRESIDQLEHADLAETRRILTDGLREFEAALLLQSTAVSGHAQIVYQMLADMIAQAGVGDMGVLSGAGGAEIAVITDIWRASQGEITVADVVREHGFHGPLEGEVSSVVWREDPTPLQRMIAEYANREDPREREADIVRQAPRRPGGSAGRPPASPSGAAPSSPSTSRPSGSRCGPWPSARSLRDWT